MKIAVIGAGVFGCTAAIKLSEAGHKVYLYEREKVILSHASGINQYRLHRGYHYPRSKETVQYVKESCLLFEEEFPSSICKTGYDRYYAISNEGSLVSPDQYLTFLSNNDLEYETIERLDIIKKDKVGLIVKVLEHGFDFIDLYLSLSNRLAKSKVNLRTNKIFTKQDVDGFDIVINATYSNLNEILPEEYQVDYQYELCEKPVVILPEEYRGKSVVVMDGEFCCFDPVGFNKDYQVLGHVKEAIHDRTVGRNYAVPEKYKQVLNKGIVYTKVSRFDKMWSGFTEYFNASEVTYKGSMFTIRTVLPQHEHDDARPSNIIKHSSNLYSIFGGKIGTCVDVANKLTKLI